jgi:hypothetical protein
MEAQAAAQKMASQHPPSAAAFRGLAAHSKSVFGDSAGDDIKCDPEQFATDDEPTDLTLDAEEKAALRMRERFERGHRFSAAGRGDESERDREQHEPRPNFDFRHLLPHVSIKTENC